ncbi:hypothetical protein GCM10011594_16380 [Nakamurella endophytica]|uniref:Putative membrane protein insertion efficiency factor n=1 Tax=Nakamurella endophytica TaxID=1748367 RepID=A0A917WDL1_9ACTN|nr:hypothetical protein GCM10011594_16380 [Nakamurella endophytica]
MTPPAATASGQFRDGGATVGTGARSGSPAARLLIAPIRFYQRFITPYTPATCRYYPTCSSYAVSALREHGAVRGSWLTVRRLGRCNPWSTGGIDRVPPRIRPRRERRTAAGSSVSVVCAGGETHDRAIGVPPAGTSLPVGPTPTITCAGSPAPMTDRSNAA